MKELFTLAAPWRLRFAIAFLALSVCLSLAPLPSFGAGESIKCAQCGTAIRPGASYLRSGALSFCSQGCLDAYWRKSLPKCAVCGSPVSNGFQKDGKAYCSQECISTTWPKCVACGVRAAKGVLLGGDQSRFICEACSLKPQCFDCQMPGDWKRLPDGRSLCPPCRKTAVLDAAPAGRIFDAARSQMKSMMDLYTTHKVRCFLVGQDRLEGSGKVSGGTEYGLFEYVATIESVSGPGVKESNRVSEESWSVYALYGLQEDKLAEVFCHELAHDWMQTYYPGIKDQKLKEGWAEYVAWRMNAICGRQALNKRIESNKDPVYGEGFRLVRQKAEKEGMDGLKSWFRRLSKGE